MKLRTRKAVALLTIYTTLFVAVYGHSDHEHGHPPIDGDIDDVFDKRLREDRQHLKEDIETYLKLNPNMLDHANPQQLHYFYFIIHDFDKNEKLDGCEMGKAVIHILEHRDGSSNTTIESLAGSLDRVLIDDDLDMDGYLSYAEFIVAQKRRDDQKPSQ
ncbi:hypothetical protein CHUAL_004046 [Chamberlinius hualienensis]